MAWRQEPGASDTMDVMELLVEVLTESQRRGFLGPGDVMFHVEHAQGYAPLLPKEPTRVVDLGAGGGLPGLVLASMSSTTSWLFLDAIQKRCDFLSEAAEELGIAHRVEVVCRRAEEVGQDEEFRGRFDAVVCRSFGAPPVAAECAAPLLRLDGLLVVSEPPATESSYDRWPEEGLAILGLVSEGRQDSEDRSFQVLRQATACPSKYPRRTGVPAKRPLW